MPGFSLIQMTNCSHMNWIYWVMMNYGKTKNFQMKFDTSIGQNWLIVIDWLILVESLISIVLIIWVVNHKPQEGKHRGKTWLIRLKLCRFYEISSIYLRTHSTTSATPYGWQSKETIKRSYDQLLFLAF